MARPFGPRVGFVDGADGHTEADEVVTVEVVTTMFDRQWWRAYATMFAQHFCQSTIHLRAMSVEVLDEENV